MKKTPIIVSAACVFLLLAGWYYLHTRVMPLVAWAELNLTTDRFDLTAEGWSTALHAWPLVLMGGLIGLVLAALIISPVVSFGLEEEYQAEIEHLKAQRDESLSIAKLYSADQTRFATEQVEYAKQLRREAEDKMGEALRREERNQAQINKYIRANKDLQKRTVNAICAAERIKQKYRETKIA